MHYYSVFYVGCTFYFLQYIVFLYHFKLTIQYTVDWMCFTLSRLQHYTVAGNSLLVFLMRLTVLTRRRIVLLCYFKLYCMLYIFYCFRVCYTVYIFYCFRVYHTVYIFYCFKVYCTVLGFGVVWSLVVF